MQYKTAQEIKDRLAEIDRLKEAYDARDFDAELKAVMLNGGDVDELENAQLEAERQARRYRVESETLRSILPDVVRSEVMTELESIKDAMADQPLRLKALADQMEPLVNQLRPLLESYAAVTLERARSYNKVHHHIISVLGVKPDQRGNRDLLLGTGLIICGKYNELMKSLETAKNLRGEPGEAFGQDYFTERYSVTI